MEDKNYLLITKDSVRELVEIPVRGRIEAIGFTRYTSLIGRVADGVTHDPDPEPNGTYPVISHEVFNELYGKVLTLVDATFQDGSQKEAFKSLIKNEMSGWYDKSTNYTLKMTTQAYQYKDIKELK